MKRIHSLALALSVPFLAAGPALAENPRPIEEIHARAVSLGTARSSPIDVTIERWSTEAEREMLLTTLEDSGREKMADALLRVRPRAGFIHAPSWPAEVLGDLDLLYAREDPTPDGGRRVVLATSRHVTFQKAGNGTRSTQYEVTVIEIRFGKDGRGEGKMVPGAKVSWDTKAKTLEIGNYSELPTDLVGVTARKG